MHAYDPVVQQRTRFNAESFQRMVSMTGRPSWPMRVALTVALLIGGAVGVILLLIVLVPAAIVFAVLSLVGRLARAISPAEGADGTDGGRENVRVIRRDPPA